MSTENDDSSETKEPHKCEYSKLEIERIKDLRFGDNWTATIYITFCPICGEKHDVYFDA